MTNGPLGALGLPLLMYKVRQATNDIFDDALTFDRCTSVGSCYEYVMGRESSRTVKTHTQKQNARMDPYEETLNSSS